MTKKIVLFTKPNCMPCRATKRYLEENGVDFEVRSLDEQANVDEIKSLKYSTAPVTIFGDVVEVGGLPSILKEGLVHFSGFAPDKLARVVADYKKSLVTP